jgi:hypothetical protein
VLLGQFLKKIKRKILELCANWQSVGGRSCFRLRDLGEDCFGHGVLLLLRLVPTSVYIYARQSRFDSQTRKTSSLSGRFTKLQGLSLPVEVHVVLPIGSRSILLYEHKSPQVHFRDWQANQSLRIFIFGSVQPIVHILLTPSHPLLTVVTMTIPQPWDEISSFVQCIATTERRPVGPD